MKGGKCLCLWTLAFFGPNPKNRQIVHSEIFDLIYHGNGGFTFSDVYNMPLWARRYYIGKIIEFKKEEKKSYENQVKKTRGGIRK